MGAKVVITVPKPNDADVLVDVIDPQTGYVHSTALVLEGETRQFYVHTNQNLQLREQQFTISGEN